jgi:hypothetical protein
VVAESLRRVIDELLPNTMASADWQIVADELIAETREALVYLDPRRSGRRGARSRR